MNILKSAFNKSKNQGKTPGQLIYQNLKGWDKARAKTLGTHLKVIQLVMNGLDGKVRQVDGYIGGLQQLMHNRIQEINSYCRNGVNDSEFFLVPNVLTSMKPCHQLLKHLLMEESQRELNLAKKAQVLTGVLERLTSLQNEECSEGDRQGGTVMELKSSIRFLIDCELPDINEEAFLSSKAVSQAYSQGADLYLPIHKFMGVAEQQLLKHQQISTELFNLVEYLSRRQKNLRMTLRSILSDWVKEDLQDKIFGEQLQKRRSDELIDDYYDIETLIPQHQELWGGDSLSEYLRNISVLPFCEHEGLVLFQKEVLYNGKIEARVVLTQQKQVYLFRTNTKQPDFTFILSRQIKMKKLGPLQVRVSQWRKVMLIKEEVTFQFTMEFNLERDLTQFLQNAQKQGCQM